jgi:hypothetical protein
MTIVSTNHVFLPVKTRSNQDKPNEISRLFTAALVDAQFCDLLLTQPNLALARGYKGEIFSLNSKDRQLILTAKSTSLADLARRWIHSIESYDG